jgi:arabinan endo-1,5-alpha-L-arabinosidase
MSIASVPVTLRLSRRHTLVAVAALMLGCTSTVPGSPSSPASGTGGQSGAGGDTGAGGATNHATGGATGEGGAPASGGASGSGGQPRMDGGAPGGASGGGGAPVTDAGSGAGGASGAGGTPSTGAAGAGGTAGDRCDVGVYDPANPPKTLAITNGDNVHDPSAILAGSTYYVFNSGLWTRTSPNLMGWSNIAQLLFPNPSWIASAVPGVTDLWAPDISYFNGGYQLYYAASTFNSKRSCIGHASRPSLSAGSWAEDGAPVICSNVTSTVNWNAIDPNVILDPAGVPWLVFGSGWDGIQIVRLTAAGAVDPTSTVTTIATRTAGVIEGAAMVRRCGYYYLFTSWDLCCLGASSTYNIRIGRSTSMTGGFVDKSGVALTQGGGTLLLGAGNGWVGPGGESVLFNGNRAYLVYHAYAATDGHFAVHVSDLTWDASGWPVTSPTP